MISNMILTKSIVNSGTRQSKTRSLLSKFTEWTVDSGQYRPTFEVKPNLDRALSFPSRGRAIHTFN